MPPPPPPTPPASPVIRATTARRAHSPKRNGRKSSCFVRANASEMDSTADGRFGMQHPPVQSLYFYLRIFSNKCLSQVFSALDQWRGSDNDGLAAGLPQIVCSRYSTRSSRRFYCELSALRFPLDVLEKCDPRRM